MRIRRPYPAITASLRRFRRGVKGAAALEAALVFPFMFTLAVGAFDVSNMLLHNHRMETQLAMAGNYLAQSKKPQNFEDRARRLALTGRTSPGGTPVIAGWSADDIIITYQQIDNVGSDGQKLYRGGHSVTIVSVSSVYDYTGVGLLSGLARHKIQLSSHFEERVIAA